MTPLYLDGAIGGLILIWQMMVLYACSRTRSQEERMMKRLDRTSYLVLTLGVIGLFLPKHWRAEMPAFYLTSLINALMQQGLRTYHLTPENNDKALMSR